MQILIAAYRIFKGAVYTAAALDAAFPQEKPHFATCTRAHEQ
jgi:hypothetical protein